MYYAINGMDINNLKCVLSVTEADVMIGSYLNYLVN